MTVAGAAAELALAHRTAFPFDPLAGNRHGFDNARGQPPSTDFAPLPHAPLPRLTLVLGGARSGKSTHAEMIVRSIPPPWAYIATAQALDAEMTERIATHRARRERSNAGWHTVEAPLELAVAVAAAQEHAVLIDCLTLWLSNVMLAGREIAPACDELLAALRDAHVPIVAVSNEVGLGIVPDNALARRFRDAQGILNQRVAAIADVVILMAAGLPLVLKEPH